MSKSARNARSRLAAYEQVSKTFDVYWDALVAAKTRRYVPRWVPAVAGVAATLAVIITPFLRTRVEPPPGSHTDGNGCFRPWSCTGCAVFGHDHEWIHSDSRGRQRHRAKRAREPLHAIRKAARARIRYELLSSFLSVLMCLPARS